MKRGITVQYSTVQEHVTRYDPRFIPRGETYRARRVVRSSFDTPIALHYGCITRAEYSKRDVCFPRVGV